MDSMYEMTPAGFKLKKCCASCHYAKVSDSVSRSIDSKRVRMRMCQMLRHLHDNSEVCANWKMHPRWEEAQREEGRVKRPAYFEWYKEKCHEMNVKTKNALLKDRETGDRDKKGYLAALAEYDEFLKNAHSIYERTTGLSVYIL